MSETLFGGLQFSTDRAFPLSTDTVVLADFVRLSKGAKVCDMGMGSGALTFLLQVRHPTAHFSGIELNPSAYEMAHQNIIDNHLENACVAYHKDLRLVSSFLPANGFTHVVANPPYFSQGSGFVHGDMASARGEETCTLSDLCESAKWLLQYGGTFTLVYRPERLCDLFWELRSRKLEPKRIQFVRHRPNSPISLVLLEAKSGGKPSLDFLPDLVLFDQAGNPTGDYTRIYRMEGATQ